MAPSSSFKPWYSDVDRIDTSGLGGEVFTEALAAFSSELAQDKEKLSWIADSKHGNLSSVLTSVRDAQTHYESRKGSSKVRQILVDVSLKIHHYNAIVDVLVQHHPEYVSLAWGAMKVLFVGVANHQTLIFRLSTGLCQVADILPRAELILQLYPTKSIKATVVALYAHILKFLLRALRWFQESRSKHALHALTRPAELQYDDLLKEISSLSHSMGASAQVSNFAEQRDIHTGVQQQASSLMGMEKKLDAILPSVQQQTPYLKGFEEKLDTLQALVLEMRESMATDQVIISSARIELRQKPSQEQLDQFFRLVAQSSLQDPVEALEISLLMRNRRRLKSSHGSAFWFDTKIQAWNRDRESSLIAVNGTWKLRSEMRRFCSGSIQALRAAKIPVVWVLQPPSGSTGRVSTIELFKYITVQAIRMNEGLHTDALLTPLLHSYKEPRTEEDWINVFTSVLPGIPLLYIILDVETLEPSSEELKKQFWPAAFISMFSKLSSRNIKTVVKVALVGHGSPLLSVLASSDLRDLLVPVGAVRLSRAPKRLPYHAPSTSILGRADLGPPIGGVQLRRGRNRR
ncbi:hypothetical protein GQ53DRAFT_824555 [Thozetella sp. PMI_491]|nr:hypothetical protein GQ53DRAFT_824555 [Thozetella sp. PMI_491]